MKSVLQVSFAFAAAVFLAVPARAAEITTGPVAVPDRRIVSADGPASYGVNPVSNDVYSPGSLDGGRIEIVSLPSHGSIWLSDSGQGPLSEINYTPDGDFAGEDVLRYRLCDAADRCSEADVTFRVYLFYPIRFHGAHVGGLQSLAEAMRPMTSVRLVPTPLRSLASTSLTVGVDPTPETPWDAGGTKVVLQALAANAGPVEWRAYVDNAAIEALDATVYVGRDGDGDGQADEDELSCVVNVVPFEGTCELEIDAAAGTSPGWWVLVHNRGASELTVPLLTGAVPMIDGDAGLSAAAPAFIEEGRQYRIWSAYDDPTMVSGERRIGFIRAYFGEDLIDVVPATAESVPWAAGRVPLRSGVDEPLRLLSQTAHEAMFIDVPQGASSLQVTVHSDATVALHLAKGAPSGTGDYAIPPAPPRDQALASSSSSDGEVSLTITGAELTAGRWYVTPVNEGDRTAALVVNAQVTGIAPVVRPGSYFNADRSGHGVFLYPAGDQIAGLWYTYRDLGKPTWYYLQAAKPGANGIWTSTVYQSTWYGEKNLLSPIGRATVTPTGADAFAFTYRVWGTDGSEPMASLGRGCPSLDGFPVDASAHWFDPLTSGTGYSVQFWDDYEYYAAFVYDEQGVARFLTAEASSFGGADATIALEQLTGFCPGCPRSGAPQRSTVGTLRRVLDDTGLRRMIVSATYNGGVPGTWSGDDDVEPLGGQDATQGCDP